MLRRSPRHNRNAAEAPPPVVDDEATQVMGVIVPDDEATLVISPPAEKRKFVRVTSALDTVLSQEPDGESSEQTKKVPRPREQNSQEKEVVAPDFNHEKQARQALNARHEAMRRHFFYGFTNPPKLIDNFFQLIKHLMERVYLLTQFRSQPSIINLLNWIAIISKHDSPNGIPDDALICEGFNFKAEYTELIQKNQEADTQELDAEYTADLSEHWENLTNPSSPIGKLSRSLFVYIDTYPYRIKEIIAPLEERLRKEQNTDDFVNLIEKTLPLLVFCSDKFLEEVVLPRVLARKLVLSNDRNNPKTQLYLDIYP